MPGQAIAVSHFRSRWKDYSILGLSLIYLLMNGFKIGGSRFLVNFNDNLAIPLAILIVVLAYLTWRNIAVGSRNRLLWAGLLTRLAVMGIRGTVVGVATWLGQEVPYPSWADLFWLLGYIPMYIALLARIGTLPNKVPAIQKVAIWISIGASSLLTIFLIIIPIIHNNDPSAVVESTLNILYPAVDLVLLILVLRILFVYQQGVYGRAWVWFLVGFALHTFSNFLFSYATTADVYSPNGQISLFYNILVDVPYNLAYLFWLIGLLIVRDNYKSHQALRPTHSGAVSIAYVPDIHIVIDTRADDKIIDVSQNYQRAFPSQNINEKNLAEFFGILPAEMDRFLKDLKTSKVMQEVSIRVITLAGPQTALLSGISIPNPQGDYSGAQLLLRLCTPEHDPNELLTDYQRGVVRSLLVRTGTQAKQEEEIKRMLSTYHLAYLQGFYNCLFNEGGSIMADAFLAELQTVVKEKGWQIGVHPADLLDVTSLSLAQTRQALPALFETAKSFVARITDAATAEGIIVEVNSHFDPAIVNNVAYYEKVK